MHLKFRKHGMCHKNLARRSMVIGLGLVCVTPLSMHAGEGGGNWDGGTAGTGATNNTRSGSVNSGISQDAILRMSAKDIELAQITARKQGKVLVIDGFNFKMTDPLRKMMEADPQSARRLIRDMRNLTTRKDRAARLAQEHQKQSRRIRTYDATIQELRGKTDDTSKAVVAEEKQRKARARAFRENLRSWVRQPLQGMNAQ